MCNAALGHDLLEDTNVTETEIVERTNERVLSFIKELTNPVDDAHTDQYMKQLGNASEEARLVKYADLIENTLSVSYNFYNLGKKWAKEFYWPILISTKGVLAGTAFDTYPKTADLMRCILSVHVDLLIAKKRNDVYQYPVRAIEQVTEAISDDDLEKNIHDSYAALGQACKG